MSIHFAEDEPYQRNVKHPDDLKTILQYLLFCAPAVSLPVRGNMVSAVSKAIEEAGSLDNIRVWCFPTPQQRLIFTCSKLVLLGPWGCGKTLFLTAEAIKLAESGGKVLYLIFCNGKKVTKKSLLAMDLEEKFKSYPNIKVQTVFFKDRENNKLREIGKDCNHIMVDEMLIACSDQDLPSHCRLSDLAGCDTNAGC